MCGWRVTPVTLRGNPRKGGRGGIWYNGRHMDRFILDTFVWLYSIPGLALNLFGIAVICLALDGPWYPVTVRTALIAFTWPVWFALAIPVMLLVGFCRVFEVLADKLEKRDAQRGEPLLIRDAIDPRRWRSRAAARGSESPSP